MSSCVCAERCRYSAKRQQVFQDSSSESTLLCVSVGPSALRIQYSHQFSGAAYYQKNRRTQLVSDPQADRRTHTVFVVAWSNSEKNKKRNETKPSDWVPYHRAICRPPPAPAAGRHRSSRSFFGTPRRLREHECLGSDRERGDTRLLSLRGDRHDIFQVLRPFRTGTGRKRQEVSCCGCG